MDIEITFLFKEREVSENSAKGTPSTKIAKELLVPTVEGPIVIRKSK